MSWKAFRRAALPWALTPAILWTLACGDSTSPVQVASVEVTPATSNRLVGETVQLTATPKDSKGAVLSGRSVAWTTSATTIATVSATGLVTGVADGTATITATIGGKSGTATVTVVDRCSTTLSVPIAVGQSQNGVLGPTDCKLSDQSYADGFVLARVNANTNVRIDLVSSAFDAYLFLFEETATDLVELAKDDDGGGGNNARIQWTLLPGRTYHIVANSFDPGATGAYTLSVTQTAIQGATAAAALPSTSPRKLPALKFVPGKGGAKLIR